MIQLKNVTKIYVDNDKATIGLKDINLTIEDTGVIAICGESGSGKSTLLKLLAKHDSPTYGEIIVDEVNTSDYDLDEMNEYRFQNISFIYQDYNLIESMTVLDNVMMPLLIRDFDSKQAKAKAEHAIKEVGLSQLIHKKCNKLSGGEKQRCAIARAIVNNSKIIISDEPTANLDPKTAKEIISLLSSLSKGRLVLISTHNFEEIKDFVNRRLVLKNSEIILDETLKNTDDCVYKEEKSKHLSFKKLIKLSFFSIFKSYSKALMMILTSIIFSIVILITFTSENVSLSKYKYTNNFPNPRENSIYILANNKPIDLSLLEKYDSYNINPREELEIGYYDIAGLKNLKLLYQDATPKLLVGRYPEKINEICINLEGNLTKYECESYLNKDIFNYKIGSTFKIVGVASNASKSYLFGNDYFKTMAKLIGSDTKISLTFGNESSMFDYSTIYCSDTSINKIILPKSAEGLVSNIDLCFKHGGDTYFCNDDSFIIEYDGVDTILEVAKGYTFDKNFDAIIYNVDTDKEISYWSGLGYYAVDMVHYRLDNEFDDNSSVYLSIGLIYVIAVSAILVFSFIFIWLFRLNNKEYLVLSSLGLNKKRTGQLLSLEFIWYLLVGFAVSLIIGLIILNVLYSNLSIANICLKSSLFMLLFMFLNMALLNRFVFIKKKSVGKGGKIND